MEKDTSKRQLWLAIIAGGQGTRLFPLSHEGCPKQFCQLDEKYTFIQATAKRFIDYGVKPNHVVVITTNEGQTELAKEQLLPFGIISPNLYQISEDYGYAGAMVMASDFISRLDLNGVIISTPADQHIVADEDFSHTLSLACRAAADGLPTIVGVKVNDLVTATGCGHAIYDSEDEGDVKKVTGFVEKPSKKEAQKLLRDDCSVVNTGINVWSVTTITDAIAEMPMRQCFGLTTDGLMARFGEQLRVAIGRFGWHDCGTLKSLYDVSHKTPNHKNASLGKGEVSRGRYCRGSLFVAADGTRIVAHAAKDVAVVSSQIEGRFVLTVVSLKDSQRVRELAEKYRENKEILTNDFSLDARNNLVVETDVSHEARFAFVGVDNYVVTPLSGPNGTIVFSVSNNIPLAKLDVV